MHRNRRTERRRTKALFIDRFLSAIFNHCRHVTLDEVQAASQTPPKTPPAVTKCKPQTPLASP